MYICICKAVTETQIKDAINEGVKTTGQLQRICTGVGSVCGSCRNEIQQLLDESKQNLAQKFVMDAA